MQLTVPERLDKLENENKQLRKELSEISNFIEKTDVMKCEDDSYWNPEIMPFEDAKSFIIRKLKSKIKKLEAEIKDIKENQDVITFPDKKEERFEDEPTEYVKLRHNKGCKPIGRAVEENVDGREVIRIYYDNIEPVKIYIKND